MRYDCNLALRHAVSSVRSEEGLARQRLLVELSGCLGVEEGMRELRDSSWMVRCVGGERAT